jgi:C-terminal processing protease CtpA/Prc
MNIGLGSLLGQMLQVGTSVIVHCCLLGSPADKADLEVGDEILEVNGKSLEDATHTEVISHIHQVRNRPSGLHSRPTSKRNKHVYSYGRRHSVIMYVAYTSLHPVSHTPSRLSASLVKHRGGKNVTFTSSAYNANSDA